MTQMNNNMHQTAKEEYVSPICIVRNFSSESIMGVSDKANYIQFNNNNQLKGNFFSDDGGLSDDGGFSW